MEINVYNAGPFATNVTMTDDNQQGRLVFNGQLADGITVAVQLAQSEAGYGDVHYKVNSGSLVASSLLKQGDTITV